MFARTEVRIVSVIAAIMFTVVVGVLIAKGEGRHVPVERNVAAAISAEDLAAAAQAKVFFGHQSVGMNVIAGISGVYAARGLPAPEIVPLPDPAGGGAQTARSGQSGYFAHAHIEQNGDPFAKIEDFDARIRDGLGREVDVAFMKFCYADVASDTDVDALFTRYRATMAALERDYPTVTFLHVTTPLTTEPSLKSKVKMLLGRSEHVGPADNAARERLNALMRREYGADLLFDLAAIESTTPDGARMSGRFQGREYFALYPGYAADAGHLNAEGSAIAAARLLGLVAVSSGK